MITTISPLFRGASPRRTHTAYELSSQRVRLRQPFGIGSWARRRLANATSAIAVVPLTGGLVCGWPRCSNVWVPKTSSGAPTRDDVPERTSVLTERPTSRIR